MMVMYLQMFRNFATGLFGFSRIFSSGITPGLVGMCTAQPPISSVAGSGNEDTAGLVSSVNAAPSNADIDSPANPDMAIAEGSGNVDRESEDWTDGAHQDNAENEICMSRAAKLAPSGYADCLHRGILALASNTLFLRNCCNHFIDFHDIPANLLAEIKDENFVYERMSNRELCSSILDDIEEARRYINEFQRSIATNFSFQPLKDVVPQDVLNLEPLFSFITECHVAPSKQAISQVLSEFEAEAETTHIKAIDESYPKMLLLYLSYVERYVKELSDKARELWNNQDFVKILPEVVKKSDSGKAKGQTSHKMSKIAEDARKKELEGSKQKKEALSTKPSANSERDGLEEQKSNPNENAANITRSTQVVPNNSVPSTHAKGEKDEVAEVGQSKASMQDKSAAKTKKLLARLSNSKTERQNREEFWEELNDKLRRTKKKNRRIRSIE
ncbi:hypothetical protein VCUG_01374 [Vavraia culicis subsp. floridensis]|uniref:Uncharacterized protein n=1 Tax=Vavraia culicis (isolate floridensis) TaxID=948595 RepID=L2GTV6_VAVCU|nr:uncharacterized protein VCUG_01374 [Vavraia culicis subsp. floridensis]ELA47101.1 hypothetical protein VCUG_01374 [Vavraia culicis subsp. floridensis]